MYILPKERKKAFVNSCRVVPLVFGRYELPLRGQNSKVYLKAVGSARIHGFDLETLPNRVRMPCGGKGGRVGESVMFWLCTQGHTFGRPESTVRRICSQRSL